MLYQSKRWKIEDGLNKTWITSNSLIWFCSSVQTGSKKGKQIGSFTKWGLGENVDLWLMECLNPTLVLIYLWINMSRLFVCLPTSELTIFEQHVCLTKIVYKNALSLGTSGCKKKKKNMATLNSENHSKKGVNFD